MRRFMNLKNNLTLKKATSNPFIIYGFYDRLEEIICENNLSAEDYGIWMRLFCLDIKKSQTIAPKGSKAYKITQGGGREYNYCWCCEFEW